MFAVAAQLIDDRVLQNGQVFALDLGEAFNFGSNQSIGSDSLSFNESSTTPPTASLQLPSSLFNLSANSSDNTSRITNSAFLTDLLFQRRLN